MSRASQVELGGGTVQLVGSEHKKKAAMFFVGSAGSGEPSNWV